MRRPHVSMSLTPRDVAVTDRLRDQIDELLSAASASLRDDLDGVARMAVRLVLHRAMEAEISQLLGDHHHNVDHVESSRESLQADEEPRRVAPLGPLENTRHTEACHNDHWRRPEDDATGLRSRVNTLRAVFEAMAAVR